MLSRSGIAPDTTENANKERQTALRDTYLNGTAPEDVEDNSEALKSELDAASERCHAARMALVEHINRAIVLVLEKSPEWVAQIAEHEAAVQNDIAELEAQLRSAQARRGEHFKIMHWLERTQAGAEFPGVAFPLWRYPSATG